MDFPFSLLTFLLLSLPTIDLWEVREKKLAPPIFDVHFGTDNFSVAHLFLLLTYSLHTRVKIFTTTDPEIQRAS